ncbi:hypothetical protein B0T22DRAFT_441888 [Podospora appendiculata]|uniref:Uncharacterized protein n=1 Tax=Podospora appendiculata TaxID=314037 RepID=A0AAE0XDS6_9PEZI|nr:hypothetical protein B0T22DRAFT_441888 [Podospora appendiculata]
MDSETQSIIHVYPSRSNRPRIATVTVPGDGTIFYPPDRSVYWRAKRATIFSRLNVLRSGEEVAYILRHAPSMTQMFCFAVENAILVFDDDMEEHTFHLDIIRLVLGDSQRDLGLIQVTSRLVCETAEDAGFWMTLFTDYGIQVVDVVGEAEACESSLGWAGSS